MSNKFQGIPLTEDNIKEYIKTTYNADHIFLEKRIIAIDPLLQMDYGEANDCTLTSITTIIHHKIKNEPIQNIYNTVEEIAKQHFYNGDFGTLSIMVKPIYEKVLKEYGLTKNTKWKMIKGIAVNIKDIMKTLDTDTPIILNFLSDGRKYQGNHTVLIVGYDIIKVNNKSYYLLRLCDNWNKQITYMDWQKLSCICSINY